MVQVWEEEQQIFLELLTNNFTWTASTISELYICRLSMESFFKEIKTHLKIKSFIGDKHECRPETDLVSTDYPIAFKDASKESKINSTSQICCLLFD
jgi:hypothetical protein